MTILEIIKKAIDGGYENIPKKLNDEFDIWENDYNAVFLDPDFWKCLGKAMGWDKMPSGDIWQYTLRWLYQWHKLIDHLAEGKSAESFFKELKSGK